MDIDGYLQQTVQFFVNPDAQWSGLRLAIIIIVTMLALYVFNRAIGAITPKLSERVSRRTDAINDANYVHFRRVETFLSLGMTILRVGVVGVVLYIAWQLTNPGSAPFALVGASTLFVVLAGATLVPLLRDITVGFIMIAERWFNVGDHIVVEPFAKLGGVVERVTLRSTRLRTLTGEVVWIHNQHMQGVRVTTAAAHRLEIDIFVNDKARGIKIMQETAKVIPSDPMTLPRPLKVIETELVSKNLWRVTATCQITPYREWIIEKFGVDVIKKTDEMMGKPPAIVHGPIVRYADQTAEKRFGRAVRAAAVASATSPVPAPEPVPKQ